MLGFVEGLVEDTFFSRFSTVFITDCLAAADDIWRQRHIEKLADYLPDGINRGIDMDGLVG